jgi:hypothetical protein
MDRPRSCLLASSRHWPAAILAAFLGAAPLAAHAGVLYEDPGWDYLFDGDTDAFGPDDESAFDGTWRRDEANSWREGAVPGDAFAAPDSPPGGIVALVEGDTTYLRLQDPGEPRDWGYVEDSNRRFWFGRNIEREHPGATSVLTTTGVTITFRARIASTGPLDPIHPQTTPDIDPEQPQFTEITPWFPKGYNVTDDGQGMFTVQENGASAVGFALALDLDTPVGVPGGLAMNNKPGTFLPGSDHTDATGANVLAMDDADLLDWHEFWITIVGAGTPGIYDVDVYTDGAAVPDSFVARTSNGAEYAGQHIAFGLSATSGYGAVDVDFFGYALGVVTPAPEPAGTAMGCAAFATLAARRRTRRSGFRERS